MEGSRHCGEAHTGHVWQLLGGTRFWWGKRMAWNSGDVILVGSRGQRVVLIVERAGRKA